MTSRPLLAVAAATATLLAACGGSDAGPAPSSPPGPGASTGRIAIRGNATFGAPHGGEAVRAALVRVSDGATLDVQKGTFAAADPSFVLTFAPVVDLSAAYQVRYWADHNSNDLCDPPPVDHQWQVDVPAGAAVVAVSHSTSFTSVCGTLTFPLTFVGTPSFEGPHAGQTWHAGLVKGGATTVLEAKSGTVAAAGVDPAFAVTFTPALFLGESYAVKLWIDSGSGSCDAAPTDHQWSVAIPTDPSSHQATVSYAHTASFTPVCSFFP